MDDIAEANAIAQLAAGANATQVQKIISDANQFDDDHWSGSWNNGDIFDDDWSSIAALAASGRLNGSVAGTNASSVLSFINATLPKSANSQAVYSNISAAIQKQVQAAKGCVRVVVLNRRIIISTATSKTST